MRIGILLFFLLFLLGCTEEKIEYEVQFELSRFEMKQFDLYNPILNTLKLDSTKRVEDSGYFAFDAYCDKNGTMRYLFYRVSSYGYLHELYYTDSSELSLAFIYPILTAWVDEGAQVLENVYYYEKGVLVALRDEFDDAVLIVDGDSVTVYRGILRSRDGFEFKKMATSDYYPRYLGLPSPVPDSTSSVE